MFNDFFKNNFHAIRGVTPEKRGEIIKKMVIDFTMHVLSTIEYDDYVIPNYVRKLLHNFTTEYRPTLIPNVDYVNVYFNDFEMMFEEKIPFERKVIELRQQIMKNTRINAIVLLDDELSDIKNIFIKSDPNYKIDVTDPDHVKDMLLIDHGYNGGDLYIRDKYCPYLIHKFLTCDDDVYNVIRESNRSITEFLTKITHEYKTSFFL